MIWSSNSGHFAKHCFFIQSFQGSNNQEHYAVWFDCNQPQYTQIPLVSFDHASSVAFCSILMNKPVQEQMVVLGDMTLGGVVNPVEDLAGSLQLAMDSGGKRVLLPMASASDIPTVPAEIFSKFQISFYADPVDAVYKALGVN